MSSKRRLPVVLAGLTLALVACEQSITSPVIPEVEFQAVQSVAMVNGSCVAPGAGLISWWPGDDDFKDVAEPLDGAEPNDIIFASNAVEGRTDPLSGTVAFDVGRVGQAFSFTSVQGQPVQFLEVADADELKPTNFTIDLWAQRTAFGQDPSDAFGNVLIMKAKDDATPGGTAFLIGWRNDGHIMAFVKHLPLANDLQLLVSTSTFNVGPAPTDVEWVHIALTVEGSTAKLYINGVLDKTVSGPAGSQITYGTSGQLGSIVIGSAHEGSRAVGVPRGFHGLIDEVDLFGHALDADEIAAIYNAGGSGKCSGDADDNAAPTVNEFEGGVIDEGDTFETTVYFTDDDSGLWTATADYGDGYVDLNAYAGTATSFGLSHTYAQDGEYTVTVTVTDDAGAQGSASATVVVNNVYQLTIDEATLRLAKRNWWRTRGGDAFHVDGRLPLDLLQRFDPASDAVTVVFAGVELTIPAGSFVRKDDKWSFRPPKHTPGIRRFDIRDDGRFRIQARGPFEVDLRALDFTAPVDFSLSFGPDTGVASIQFDRKLRYRSRHGVDFDNKFDGKEDDEDDDDGHGNRGSRGR